MRPIRLSRYGASVSDLDAWREQEEAASLPPIEEFEPLSLPVMQQAALMQMHESHVSRAIKARLLEDSQDGPHNSDYQALVDLGFAARRHAERWHHLTTEGAIVARKLEQKLCGRFNIHILQDRGASGSWQQRFGCPCGWSTLVRRSSTAPANAASAFKVHRETARRLANLGDVLRRASGE